MAGTDVVNKKKKPQKPSPEETAYKDAVGLMEAVECTSRFERTVLSLRSAADKFEKIGGYKDAAVLAKKCRDMAEEARKTGAKSVYLKALDKTGNAKTKSDYVDAIEDFERVKKFNYNVEECKEQINKCKTAIGHLETIAAYKRRGIALAILVALIVVFINTPFFPLVKGLIHQSKGEYTAAIEDYKAANGILMGNGNMKKCYYALGEEAYKQEDYKKAFEYYKKAEDKRDAPLKKKNLEQMFIRESGVGDIVEFGKAEWIVLDKDGDNALLLKKEINKKKAFDTKGRTSWLISSYRDWLNKKYKSRFSQEERDIMVEQYIDKPAKKGELKERFFPLSAEQYSRYKEIIPLVDKTYWLKDGSIMNNQVKAVAPDGSIIYMKPDDSKVYSRQACVVNFNIKETDSKKK